MAVESEERTINSNGYILSLSSSHMVSQSERPKDFLPKVTHKGTPSSA